MLGIDVWICRRGRVDLVEPGHSNPWLVNTIAERSALANAASAPRQAATTAAAAPATAKAAATSAASAAAASATPAAAATTAAAPGFLNEAARPCNVLLVEHMERRQADVGDFLVTESECLTR
jgi:hypothetical protein